MARDVFYVGYLPLPTALKVFVPMLVAVLVAVAIVIAGITTSQQNAPGPGTWDLSNAVTIEGVMLDQPYAMIHGRDGSEKPILLVTMGKIGGSEFTRGHARATIVISVRTRMT